MNSSDDVPQIPGRAKLALAAGLGGLLVILIALGSYAADVLNRARTADSESARLYLLRRGALTDVRSSVFSTGSYMRDYLVDPDESRYRVHAEFAGRAWDRAQESFQRYWNASEDQLTLQRLEREMTEYKQITQRGLRLSGLQRRTSGYRLFAEEIGPARDALLATIERVAQEDDRKLRGTISDTAAFLSQLRLRLWQAIGLSLLVGMIVAALVYRYLIKLEFEAANRYEQSVEATAQLEQLSHRLLAVQEDERKALARELHDDVGQSLGAFLVDVGQAKNVLFTDPVEAAVRLKSASVLGERALQSVRDISLLLRPSMLDDLGLIPALHWEAREISRRTGMHVAVRSEDDDLHLEEELRTTVYRIVQEALQNAARHSGAKATEVGIATGGAHLQILIRDNGKGFEPSRTRGLGLLGIQERVSRLAGKLRITSAPGQGTTLTIDLPLEAGKGSSKGETKDHENADIAG